jgi:hypothetical protein
VRGPVLALGVPGVGPRGIREESRDSSTLSFSYLVCLFFSLPNKDLLVSSRYV